MTEEYPILTGSQMIFIIVVCEDILLVLWTLNSHRIKNNFQKQLLYSIYEPVRIEYSSGRVF